MGTILATSTSKCMELASCLLTLSDTLVGSKVWAWILGLS